MTIHYSLDADLRADQVAAVFVNSGIKRPAHDLDRIQKMIDHADVIVSAWDGEQLVGIARAITDFSYCCYLSDLAVGDAYQKRGIGTEMIRRLQVHLGEEVSLLLLSAPSAMDYYPRIGFQPANNAFLIRRVK